MLKKKITITTILVLVLATFIWLFNRSFIKISTQNTDDTTYTLLNQKTGQTENFTTKEPVIKKLVKKGSYEIFAQNNKESFITVVKTGGFLQTTAIEVSLSPEKSRSFVGNNPAPCMHYLSNVLVSYVCSGLFNRAQLHVPATPHSPTIVRNPEITNDGSVEDIIKTTSGENLILIKAPGHDESDVAPHTLYRLGEDLSLSSPTILDSLKDGVSYQLKVFGDGFIAHDSVFEHAVYFSNNGTKLKDITLGKVENSQLVPYSLSVSADEFIVAYGSSERLAVDTEPHTHNPVPSEIIVHNAQTQKRLSFDKQYGFVHLCGTDKLCGLYDEWLEVFDISDDSPRLLFRVSGIQRIDKVGEQLVLVRDNQVFGFDVDSRTGASQYSFGEYEFCGLEISGVEYVLCLINDKNDKIALAIDPSSNNMDSIDKKVLDLLKLPEVKNISAYKNILYVSPDLGDLIYVPEFQGFGYDPAIKNRVNATINQAVDELGIDRQKYQIINTLN